MERQYVASVIIIKNCTVLMVFHKKFQKWMLPGGHCDPNEIPSEAAIREAFEETGLKIELTSQENVWADQPNAKSVARPYACLLETIPAYGTFPKHEHYDSIFVGKPLSGNEKENPIETEGLRWFSFDEIQQLDQESLIFPEVKTLIQSLLPLESTQEAGSIF